MRPELDELRAAIDENDRALVAGVNERLRLVTTLWRLKRELDVGLLDTDRERNLRAQLARGGEHEHMRLARTRRGAVEPGHGGDAEGQRLARSGRRLGEDVHTGERIGNDELLDGERGDDLACSERLGQVGAHTELAE